MYAIRSYYDSAYGFSSFLVPCFLLFAAVVLLVPGWTYRAGFALAASPLPFLTAAAAERLLRGLHAARAGDSLRNNFV